MQYRVTYWIRRGDGPWVREEYLTDALTIPMIPNSGTGTSGQTFYITNLAATTMTVQPTEPKSAQPRMKAQERMRNLRGPRAARWS
jgi:hypothetical protein